MKLRVTIARIWMAPCSTVAAICRAGGGHRHGLVKLNVGVVGGAAGTSRGCRLYAVLRAKSTRWTALAVFDGCSRTTAVRQRGVVSRRPVPLWMISTAAALAASNLDRGTPFAQESSSAVVVSSPRPGRRCAFMLAEAWRRVARGQRERVLRSRRWTCTSAGSWSGDTGGLGGGALVDDGAWRRRGSRVKGVVGGRRVGRFAAWWA